MEAKTAVLTDGEKLREAGASTEGGRSPTREGEALERGEA